MSHVFISHSNKNNRYANKLANKLRKKGFNVWIDDEDIHTGDNWQESIISGLRTAGAFIVIMTAEAAASDWVQREVKLANQWQIKAFPILLDGQIFPIYDKNSTQYETVRRRFILGPKLPKDKFYTLVAKEVGKSEEKGDLVTLTDLVISASQREDIKNALHDLENEPIVIGQKGINIIVYLLIIIIALLGIIAFSSLQDNLSDPILTISIDCENDGSGDGTFVIENNRWATSISWELNGQTNSRNIMPFDSFSVDTTEGAQNEMIIVTSVNGGRSVATESCP